MVKFMLAALAAASCATVASAQETAPDGSRAFGLEPYVGLMGGYDSYDARSDFGLSNTGRNLNGPLVMAVAGVNVPLGPVFVGAEGFGARGIDSDVKYEYGARGRFGARAGESGLIFVSAGYQWTNAKGGKGFADHNGWLYGAGVEVGPKDIGLAGLMGEAGPRLRLQIDTYEFDSLRPMAGVVWHF